MSTLTQATQAWREFLRAEAELARLRKYRNPSRVMRDDADTWARRYREARQRLSELLGAPA